MRLVRPIGFYSAHSIGLAALIGIASTLLGAHQVTNPPARGHFGITYDEKIGQTVVSCGVAFVDGNMTFRNDQWGWDGDEWIRDGSGLSIMGHRLTYDSKRQRTVMFGGIVNRSQDIGDLRVWAAGQWVMLKAWPELRAGDPGLCYDSDRDRIVAVVTNAVGRCLNTYEWDGEKWTKSTSTIPGARGGYSIAYDAKRKTTVLFGGSEQERRPTDVWEYDGKAWTQKTAAGPTGRGVPGFVFDDRLGAIVMHGGMGADYNWLKDTWSWDGTAWTKLSESGPGLELGMAYDKKRDRVVVVGNSTHENNTAGMETWEWDGKSWAKVSP
jgi:hypothetical protein